MRKSIFAEDYVPFGERAKNGLATLVVLFVAGVIFTVLWMGLSWIASLDSQDTVRCSPDTVSVELPEDTEAGADKAATLSKLAQRRYPNLWYYNYEPVTERIYRDNPDLVVTPGAPVQVPRTCHNVE